MQAAATARVTGGRDIVKSAENEDGVSVLCHVIADADALNSETDCDCPTPPSAPHLVFINFMR